MKGKSIKKEAKGRKKSIKDKRADKRAKREEKTTKDFGNGKRIVSMRHGL